MIKIHYTSTQEAIEFDIYNPIVDVTIYPKSYKVNMSWCDYSNNYRRKTKVNRILKIIRIQAILSPNGVNNGINESGIKRLENFLKKTISQYGKIKFIECKFLNSIPLPDNLKKYETK